MHPVGGADQVEGQLGFGWLGADALLTWWNLWRNFRGIGGGDQDFGFRS